MELTQESLTNNLYVWENPKLRELFNLELTTFFQAYIKQNTVFSRGDFQRGGAYNVYFIPTSGSYDLWGQYVTVINVPAEYAEEVLHFNSNQDSNSNLVKQYAIVYGEDEIQIVVTFDMCEVYQIEGL